MEIRTTEILDPTAQPKVQKTTIAPSTCKLADKIKVGFLWNNKPNGDILLLNIKELLSQRYQLGVTSWQQKSSVAAPADISKIQKLATDSDLVIVAIAD